MIVLSFPRKDLTSLMYVFWLSFNILLYHPRKILVIYLKFRNLYSNGKPSGFSPILLLISYKIKPDTKIY